MLDKLEEVRNAILPWFLERPDPNVYLGDDWVVVDLETTAKDHGSALNPLNDIVLATWATKDGVFHHWGGIHEQAELVKAIQSARFVVAQNAKFELQWFIRLGIDISKILVYDTLLADYVIAGNRRWRLDLDSISKRYGVASKHRYGKSLVHAGVCPSDVPRSILLEYGLSDTINEKEIFLKQRLKLRDLGLLGIVYTRCLTCVVLADIETKGLYLDAERVRAEFHSVSEKLAELELAINGITGGINANSPKQLGEFLYDRLGFEEAHSRRGEPERTASGRRKVDADAIKRLRPTTEAQRTFQALILERQKLNKKHQILEKLKRACDEEAGYLYARFNQAVTQTHRLSSAGARYKIQFQNVPREYKSLFTARTPGWRVGEADGAQLEFRVAAHLGRDVVAAQDIRDKVDVHKNTASALLSIPLEKVSKEQRQDAKPETFRPLYGSNGQTPAQKRYAQFFHDRYKGIYDAQTQWTYGVLATKELKTEWGMRFYWPDTEIEGRNYIRNTTSIFNYPVQSFATAEIILISLVYLWHRVRSLALSMFLVNTVHDSIISELPPEEVPWWKALSYQCFTYDTYDYLRSVYNVEFTVPLGVEVKIGEHWGEGKGESWDVEPTPAVLLPAGIDANGV
jgi:DNA polymerase I - 3''-5'' exonuclease and polymerase domains